MRHDYSMKQTHFTGPPNHPQHGRMKMAYDLGTANLFAPNGGPPPQSLASLWPTVTAAGPPPPPSLVANLPYGGARLVSLPMNGAPGLTSQLNPALSVGLSTGLAGMNGLNGGLYGAPPSMMESIAAAPIPPKPEVIHGNGKLTWLSSKAGLITCSNGKTISFQIKDFCDNQLTDLTLVLRVGFTLCFQAAMSESNEYIATLVSPLYGNESEKVFANSSEANLEDAAPQQTGSNKDAYTMRIEERAIPTLLAIFQRHATPHIQLSSLHSQMSGVSGQDDELFRYVGSSSLKRRQFIERRTHLFTLSADDTISLQQPSIYSCVLRLASHLLRRGGVTAIESLYEFYLSPNMPPEIRATIGEIRSRFIDLLGAHPWIFSIFPNRTYVSVRRNLPHYDYPEFVRTYFAEHELFRPQFNRTNYQATATTGTSRPGGLSRTMSTHGSGAPTPGGGPQPLIPANRHQSACTPTGNRPISLWGETDSAGTSPDWYSSNGGTSAWGAPRPLMAIGNVGLSKDSRSLGTQTDVDASGGVGSYKGCVCTCNCGAKEMMISKMLSRSSASPPSAGSHSPHGSPTGMNTRNIEAALDAAAPMRYYDPFGGNDFGFSGLSLN